MFNVSFHCYICISCHLVYFTVFFSSVLVLQFHNLFQFFVLFYFESCSSNLYPFFIHPCIFSCFDLSLFIQNLHFFSFFIIQLEQKSWNTIPFLFKRVKFRDYISIFRLIFKIIMKELLHTLKSENLVILFYFFCLLLFLSLWIPTLVLLIRVPQGMRIYESLLISCVVLVLLFLTNKVSKSLLIRWSMSRSIPIKAGWSMIPWQSSTMFVYVTVFDRFEFKS